MNEKKKEKRKPENEKHSFMKLEFHTCASIDAIENNLTFKSANNNKLTTIIIK